MATLHAQPTTQLQTRTQVQTIPAEHGQSESTLPILTDPDKLLPIVDTSRNPSRHRLSGTSFLSSDTEPSPTSSISATSPFPGGRFELSPATASSMPVRPKPPPPLSSPLLFTSYEHGAPLSDIGEEEMTPISARPRSRSPSPTAHALAMAHHPGSNGNEKSERRLSAMSTCSTTSIGSDSLWDELYTGANTSDRLKADLAAAGDESFPVFDNFTEKRNGIAQPDYELNHMAEQILANAKKRLTNMEGNLNKARTSLIITPKSSPLLGEHMQAGSLYRSISQGGDRRPNAASPRKLRPTQSLNKGLAPVHSRHLSETSVSPSSVTNAQVPSETRSASAMEYGYGAKSIDSMLDAGPDSFTDGNTFPPRGVKRSPLAILEEEDPTVYTPSAPSQHVPSLIPGGLGISSLSTTHSRSLSGNDVGSSLGRSRSQMTSKEVRDQAQRFSKQSDDLGTRHPGKESRRRNSLQNLHSPTAVSTPEEWYTGAAEYKGGSPTLSTNAGMGKRGEDGVKAASTRSPLSELSYFSPQSFYSPAGWPASAEKSWIDMSSGLPDAPQPQGQDGRSPARSPNLPVQSINAIGGSGKLSADNDDQNTYIQESHYEDAFEGRNEELDYAVAASEEEQVFLNEVLEESLHDAEPAVPPIPEALAVAESQRHEDRADAFDYETFFLHSALGNYTQTSLHRRNVSQATNDSRLSNASLDSVETTRPARTEKDEVAEFAHDGGEGDLSDDEASTPTAPRAPYAHFRSMSTDSVSSSATFATATEGDYDGSGDDRSDTMPDDILHWGQGPGGMVGAWPSPPSTQRNKGGFEHRGGIAQLINGYTSPLATPMAETEDPISSRGSDQSTPPAKPPPPIDGQQRRVWSNGDSSNRSIGSDNDLSDNTDEDSLSQQTPPNTEVLITALVTLANPDFRPRGNFSEIDKDLVVSVLRSVGVACEGINASDCQGDVHETRTWRRRLDTARRILDGEVDVEDE